MDHELMIKQAREREQYHLSEAKRYRETAETLAQFAKEAKKAGKHVDAARERAAGKKKSGTHAKGPSENRAAIGQLLVAANGSPLTLDEVVTRVKLPGTFPKRTASVILAGMKKHDLVRQRSDGSFSAKAKLVALVESNGHSAEA